MAKALGKITPIRAYQTTDGKKFVGADTFADARKHQRKIDKWERIRSASRIPEEIKDQISGSKLSFDLTSIWANFAKSQLEILHCGNIGNRVKDVQSNVDHMLGEGAWKELEGKAESMVEDGSPDYSYTRTLTF